MDRKNELEIVEEKERSIIQPPRLVKMECAGCGRNLNSTSSTINGYEIYKCQECKLLFFVGDKKMKNIIKGGIKYFNLADKDYGYIIKLRKNTINKNSNDGNYITSSIFSYQK